LLIFTPIFSSKTNKSYKITLFAAANHPIFQISPKIPHFLDFLYFFFSFFSYLFVFSLLDLVHFSLALRVFG